MELLVRNILMVCVGNICRSPMAAAILKKKADSDGLSLNVDSAGISPLPHYPADPHAIALMRERNLDISQHRSQPLTLSMLQKADLILTMSSRQQEQIKSKLHSISGKVDRLGKWEGFDIPDPYQRPRKAFENTLVLIEVAIESWYKRIKEVNNGCIMEL